MPPFIAASSAAFASGALNGGRASTCGALLAVGGGGFAAVLLAGGGGALATVDALGVGGAACLRPDMMKTPVAAPAKTISGTAMSAA
jgi:hypothetical protein